MRLGSQPVVARDILVVVVQDTLEVYQYILEVVDRTLVEVAGWDILEEVRWDSFPLGAVAQQGIVDRWVGRGVPSALVGSAASRARTLGGEKSDRSLCIRT